MGHKEIGWNGMGWLYLAEDRDKWWAVLDAAVNSWVS
jgi:hypothetical protein